MQKMISRKKGICHVSTRKAPFVRVAFVSKSGRLSTPCMQLLLTAYLLKLHPRKAVNESTHDRHTVLGFLQPSRP